VLHQQPVEQGLVAVVQGGQPDVPLQVVAFSAQVLQLQRHLLLDGGDPRREQPAQPEPIAFGLVEGGVLVQQRARQQLGASERHHDRAIRAECGEGVRQLRAGRDRAGASEGRTDAAGPLHVRHCCSSHAKGSGNPGRAG
jgi:hypothetical protein